MNKTTAKMIVEQTKAIKNQAKLLAKLHKEMLETAFASETFLFLEDSQKAEWGALQDAASAANQAFHAASAKYNGQLWDLRHAKREAGLTA